MISIEKARQLIQQGAEEIRITPRFTLITFSDGSVSPAIVDGFNEGGPLYRDVIPNQKERMSLEEAYEFVKDAIERDL